ncbi:MAG: hypothetical protein ACOYM7_03715 [Paludibacter sp.]
MKDFTISGNRMLRELITFIVCFVIAFSTNVMAIVIYKTQFSELFSSLHYVLIFSFVLYFIWIAIRLLVAPIKYLILPKKIEKKKHNRRIRANYKPMKL